MEVGCLISFLPQEEDRKELSLRAIVGLSPEQQDQAVGAAASAEQQYKKAGHAAADQAEAGAEKLTEQVRIGYTCLHSAVSVWPAI